MGAYRARPDYSLLITKHQCRLVGTVVPPTGLDEQDDTSIGVTNNYCAMSPDFEGYR